MVASSAPLISVVMPVYNAERFLREAVESICAQTCGDFELIAIDDGSTDRSLEMMKRFAGRDRRIRLISRPHTGIVGALNDGLAVARGEFMARMDADDASMPMRFEKELRFLREHPDYELVSARVLLIDEEGEPICEFPNVSTHEEIMAAYDRIEWPVINAAGMMRRATVEAVGRYRQEFETLEDMDLTFRLVERGRVCNLPDVLYKYRQHFSATCHAHADRQNSLRAALYRETYERRRIRLNRDDKDFESALRTVPEEHRRWAWRALDAGNIRTARKHAFRVMARWPLHVEAWRLLVCALRGR